MVKVPPWFKSAVNKTRSLRRRAVLFSLILVAGRYKLITNLMQFAQLLFLPCVAIFKTDECSLFTRVLYLRLARRRHLTLFKFLTHYFETVFNFLSLEYLR